MLHEGSKVTTIENEVHSRQINVLMRANKLEISGQRSLVCLDPPRMFSYLNCYVKLANAAHIFEALLPNEAQFTPLHLYHILHLLHHRHVNKQTNKQHEKTNTQQQEVTCSWLSRSDASCTTASSSCARVCCDCTSLLLSSSARSERKGGEERRREREGGETEGEGGRGQRRKEREGGREEEREWLGHEILLKLWMNIT